MAMSGMRLSQNNKGVQIMTDTEFKELKNKIQVVEVYARDLKEQYKKQTGRQYVTGGYLSAEETRRAKVQILDELFWKEAFNDD
jgi:hypothetical protein